MRIQSGRVTKFARGPISRPNLPPPERQSLTCGARWSTCASSSLFARVTNAPRRLRSRQDRVAFAAAHTLRNTPPSPPHAQELVIMASSLATHQFAGASAQFKCVARARFRARESGDFHAGIAPGERERHSLRIPARRPTTRRAASARDRPARAPRRRMADDRARPPPPPGPPPRARTSRPRATKCVRPTRGVSSSSPRSPRGAAAACSRERRSSARTRARARPPRAATRAAAARAPSPRAPRTNTRAIARAATPPARARGGEPRFSSATNAPGRRRYSTFVRVPAARSEKTRLELTDASRTSLPPSSRQTRAEMPTPPSLLAP